MSDNRITAPRNKFLPLPASCPDDCLVGPTESELLDPLSFVHWGYSRRNDGPCDGRRNVSSKKRKLSGDGDGKDEHKDDRTETSQVYKINTFQQAIGVFVSSGCCVLKKPVLPKQFIQICLDRAKADYVFLESLIAQERDELIHDNIKIDDGSNNSPNDKTSHHHRLVALTRQDYAEWVARDGGRIDIRYGLNRYPYSCGGLIYNSIVFPLVKALLNGETDDDDQEPVQLLYAGIMWGMSIGGGVGDDDTSLSTNPCSKSPHQKWHADGGHLFASHQLLEGLTLPPHCINVFYPLVDLTEDNGPTEFRIASHRASNSSKNKENVEFSLTCPAGGAVLFDYRIQHRGRANLLSSSTGHHDSINKCEAASIDRARPVLYLAYSKTYFKDHGNTRSGRRLVSTGMDSLWTTRTLEGRPVPYGKGFDDYLVGGMGDGKGNLNKDQGDATDPMVGTKERVSDNHETNLPGASVANNIDGVGERWILFQMTLELPDGKSETLKVYRGDIAVEVAQQFCLTHGLQDDFVSVLAQTIQGQMDQCC